MATLNLQDGDVVFEPNAGQGHLAQVIRSTANVTLDACEINPTFREILRLKGFNVVGNDVFAITEPKYDAIAMNPPFGEKGSMEDIDHVRHCFGLLKPGGRLAAIMQIGVTFRTTKKAKQFREWVEELSGTFLELPDNAFMASDVKTGVKCCMVVLRKAGVIQSAPPAPAEPRRILEMLAETPGGDVKVEVFALAGDRLRFCLQGGPIDPESYPNGYIVTELSPDDIKLEVSPSTTAEVKLFAESAVRAYVDGFMDSLSKYTERPKELIAGDIKAMDAEKAVKFLTSMMALTYSPA